MGKYLSNAKFFHRTAKLGWLSVICYDASNIYLREWGSGTQYAGSLYIANGTPYR